MADKEVTAGMRCEGNAAITAFPLASRECVRSRCHCGLQRIAPWHTRISVRPSGRLGRYNEELRELYLFLKLDPNKQGESGTDGGTPQEQGAVLRCCHGAANRIQMIRPPLPFDELRVGRSPQARDLDRQCRYDG
jgi:hypothetical protein